MTEESVRIKSVVRNPVVSSDTTPRPFVALDDVESGTGRLLSAQLDVRAGEGVCYEAGDVLFGKLRPYLAKSYLAEQAGAGTGEFLVLRPGSQVDSRFLFYLSSSRSWIEWAVATSYGTKMPRTSWEGMANLRIWLPSLEEQRKIADFLDIEIGRIGALVSARNRMRELLELRRERTIESMLGLTNGESAKVSTVPLSYLARDVVVGIVVTPAAWYVEIEGVAALRGLNVRPGRIDTSDLVLISPEGDALHSKSRLRAGDVVVVRTGQAGAAAVVTDKYDGFNCIDLVIVRTGPQLDPNYLSYFLNSDHTRNRVSEYAVGSIQSHFNVGAMKRVPVPAIPVEEQRKVVKQLDEETDRVDRLLGRLALQERVLVERRQALITAAVTGQIDVTTARGAEL